MVQSRAEVIESKILWIVSILLHSPITCAIHDIKLSHVDRVASIRLKESMGSALDFAPRGEKNKSNGANETIDIPG